MVSVLLLPLALVTVTLTGPYATVAGVVQVMVVPSVLEPVTNLVLLAKRFG